MNFNQLTTAQLEELAQNYLTEHSDHEPSYAEMADALQIVGRDTLATEYAGTEFTPDDFFCTAGQPEPPARHYYAIYSPQGVHAPSTRDTLYRYDTAAHRAEDIERVNRQSDTVTLMQAVPRAFAKKRFPRAFARDVIVWRPWSDGDRHFTAPIWSDDEHGAQEYTGRPRNVIAERYEVRQVDAWHDGEGWTYNDSRHLGNFITAGDPARALRRFLKSLGVTFYRGRTVTEYDGDIYEICDRATRQPLFAAIPQEV